MTSNKTIIVSGASRGLGYFIASSFIKAGYTNLVITARDKVELFKAKELLEADKLSEKQIISAVVCDISIEEDVLYLAKFCLNNFDSIDVLINNASVFGPINFFENANFNEWLETININYIGTARIIKLLLPQIKKSSRGKIINIVGGGASKPYGCLSGYATSKVAIVRFTEELASELSQYNIDVNSIAPGPLKTRFVSKMLEAGVDVLGKNLFDVIEDIHNSGGTPMNLPSELCCYLASEKSNGITGKMLSAKYDDWKNFPIDKTKMNISDIYTLRRVSK